MWNDSVKKFFLNITSFLQEILDSFVDTEFWYVDQGILAPEADGSTSFRKALQRQEEKWWLPVPRVPPGGLHENSRKQLQHKRDCTNQILKAAMAINSITLADMEVPESYLESLPKVKERKCIFGVICSRKCWSLNICYKFISEWPSKLGRSHLSIYFIGSVHT